MNKPVDQCARKYFLALVKRKKDVSDFHLFHAGLRVIENNKDSNMLWVSMKEGVDQIHSCHIPPAPQRSLGA